MKTAPSHSLKKKVTYWEGEDATQIVGVMLWGYLCCRQSIDVTLPFIISTQDHVVISVPDSSTDGGSYCASPPLPPNHILVGKQQQNATSSWRQSCLECAVCDGNIRNFAFILIKFQKLWEDKANFLIVSFLKTCHKYVVAFLKG